MTPPIATLVLRAHGHAPGAAPMRRVVIRMARADLARVDALRPRLKATRAALIRAFCLAGLAMAEEQVTPGEAAP